MLVSHPIKLRSKGRALGLWLVRFNEVELSLLVSKNVEVYLLHDSSCGQKWDQEPFPELKNIQAT